MHKYISDDEEEVSVGKRKKKNTKNKKSHLNKSELSLGYSQIIRNVIHRYSPLVIFEQKFK